MNRAPLDQELLLLHYDELRRIARRMLAKCNGRLTLQPTDLVHEATLRLMAGKGVAINDETHFLALCARTIRTTLVDEVRRRSAAKRSCEIVTLWPEEGHAEVAIDIVALDRMLDELAQFEPEAARIVELRFFVGLTMEEIARTLSLSESTAVRRWRVARAWLFKELQAA